MPDRTTSWIVRPPGDATGTLAFAGLVVGVVVAALSVVALLGRKRGWPRRSSARTAWADFLTQPRRRPHQGEGAVLVWRVALTEGHPRCRAGPARTRNA